MDDGAQGVILKKKKAEMLNSPLEGCHIDEKLLEIAKFILQKKAKPSDLSNFKFDYNGTSNIGYLIIQSFVNILFEQFKYKYFLGHDFIKDLKS
jgi:hypothetical protein